MHLHHNNVFISRATAFLWLIKNVIFKELFPPQKTQKMPARVPDFLEKKIWWGESFGEKTCHKNLF